MRFLRRITTEKYPVLRGFLMEGGKVGLSHFLTALFGLKNSVCILISVENNAFKFVLIRGTESPPFFGWISGSKVNKKLTAESPVKLAIHRLTNL